MPPRLSQGAQHPPHQISEHLPGQPSAPIAAAALVERVLKEHGEVLGQGSGLVHGVKNQCAEQMGQRYAGLAASSFTDARQAGRAEQRHPGGQETGAREAILSSGCPIRYVSRSLVERFISNRALGMFSHPKGK